MKSFEKGIVLLPLIFALLCTNLIAGTDEDYRVGTGDVLRVTVYDHPDLNTIARVDSDGCILFPLAGRLEVGGKTTSAASQIIAAKLDGVYVINPQVAVFVEQFKSKKVVVIGEVVKPGLYELSGPTSLLELISTAGGLTKGAGGLATIRRAATGSGVTEKNVEVDIGVLLETGSDESKIPLYDGDTVTIASAGVFYVTGQVQHPSAYSLAVDTTVIKAVTMAGGFTPLAAKGKVKIIRKIGGQEKVLERVSLYEKLAPEDVLVVPESFF